MYWTQIKCHFALVDTISPTQLFPYRHRLYFWSETIFGRSAFSFKHFPFTSSDEDDLFSKKAFFVV